MKNPKKYVLPFCLLILLLLAACGGGSAPAEPAVNNDSGETAVSTESELMEDEQMDEEMADEAMDDEHMEEEAMDDEAMDDEHMDEAMDEEMADESMDEEMADETMEEEVMEEAGTASNGPEWLTLTLADARTGDMFSLADFAGKTVYVEPMATWCTNCRRQLNTLSADQDQLPSDVIVVALSVEPNLPNDVLAGYADNQGYSFLFAVATPELVEAMVGEYGRSAVNPPATPHFIIRPDGSLTELSTGFHSIEEIVAQIQAETQ